MTAEFERVFWLDESGLRDYALSFAPRLYKWVLFRREGKFYLAAMPREAGLDFHMQLLASTAVGNGWCGPGDAEKFLSRYDGEFYEAGIEALGGGTRLSNGTIRNYSYRFGPVPERYRPAVEAALHIIKK